MKGRKFDKKLVLHKETVAHLTDEGMSKVQAGKLPTYWTACLYTCTGEPCYGWDTDEFRNCTILTGELLCPF